METNKTLYVANELVKAYKYSSYWGYLGIDLYFEGIEITCINQS